MSLYSAIDLLNKECYKCSAFIENFDNLNSDIKYQLNRLGICKGCPISLSQKTLFSDPLVFEINDSIIALRKKDAKHITIKIS